MTLYGAGELLFWGCLFLAPFLWFYLTVRQRQGDDIPWRPEDHDGGGLPYAPAVFGAQKTDDVAGLAAAARDERIIV